MARTKTVPKKNPETPEKQGTDSDNDSDSDNEKNVFNTVSSSVAKKPDNEQDLFSDSDLSGEELFKTNSLIPSSKIKKPNVTTSMEQKDQEDTPVAKLELANEMDPIQKKHDQNKCVIRSIVSNYLFPRVKFLNRKDDMEYSDEKRDICGFILSHCNLKENEKRDFWSTYKKYVASTVSKLRCDRTKDMRKAFHGKL